MALDQPLSRQVLGQFYEDSLCWLGRSHQVYRLLSEAVLPPISSWVRGDVDSRTFNSWQREDLRTFLFPVVSFDEHEATLLGSEALLLCGYGSYYNPCDVAIAVFVQQPRETLSQLLRRVRQAEALVSRGPDIAMTTEHVRLTHRGQGAINTKYLLWPHSLSAAALDTLAQQGYSLITLSPAHTSQPFCQQEAE